MERQFTATVYIVEQERILLILHRKLNKWLPPGGHLDPNETPAEAARREAREETGIEIQFIKQENLWIERWNARSFERPYFCLIQEIPPHKETPAHQHIDFIYLARPVGGLETPNAQEIAGMRWFTLEEVETLIPDQDIFLDTQEAIRSLMADVKDREAMTLHT